MVRKKSSALPGTPAGQEQTQPTTEATPASPDPRERPTNRELVRRAIEAGKSKPQDGVRWIKDEYGVDMTPASFGVTKNQLKKANGGEAGPSPRKRGRKPKAARAASTAPAPSPAPAASGPVGHAEAARAVKDLVERLGADEVIDLARLFGGE